VADAGGKGKEGKEKTKGDTKKKKPGKKMLPTSQRGGLEEPAEKID